MLTHELQGVDLDFGLICRDDRDRTVGSKVGIQERKNAFLVASTGTCGSDQCARDLDAGPSTRDQTEFEITEHCYNFLVSQFVAEVSTR